jgi:hypothetical protein
MNSLVKNGLRLALPAAVTLGALFATAPALAQYSFDPNNADEQAPGVKYFGSAKDDRGALLPGVTVLVAHAFAMVTDDQGRYRGNLPYGAVDDSSPIGCAKPGYTEIRMSKRPGPPGGVKETVQVDCVLRKDK